MSAPDSARSVFRRRIALPTDHGSWFFLATPLVIGLFAGGSVSAATPLLVVAAFAAFLIRQPVTTAVKAYSGRRPRDELPAARFWIAVYGLIGLAAAGGLLALGFGYIMVLALPAIPVFAWYLVLVSRRAERRQMGVEILGSGVLALAAPAAYWTGIGAPDALGGWLWALSGLQSAGSIMYAYLRLEQRVLPGIPDLRARMRMGARAIALCGANTGIALVVGIAGVIPAFVFVPFSVQFAEAVWGTVRPAVGARPARIGARQSVVSALFTLLFIVCWRLR
ncbi:MAG: YwiC-like family protein [Thermoflexales bacterium]